MTTSKFKAFGILALILSGLLFLGICFLIYVLIYVVFFGGHIIPRGTLPPLGAIIFIILFIILDIIIIYSWIPYAFTINIDTNQKTIKFKNIITQRVAFYTFDEFDCYIDTFVRTIYDEYKVLYLIKEKKAEKIITGFYYANIDELQEAILSIEYFGFQKDFATLARKAIFKKAIIESRSD